MVENSNNFNFIKKEKTVNDFDEIVCQHEGDDVALGNFIKFFWFPKTRFYEFNVFLGENYHFALSLCTDELLIKLYKESICLIAQLRNISIASFPEETILVKEKFQQNQKYDKKLLLSNQNDSFYKLYLYNPDNEINLFDLTFLINTLIERGLSEKVKMYSQDINKLFKPQFIIGFQDDMVIDFFLKIPVEGSNFSLLDKYLDNVIEYIAEQENNEAHMKLFNLRFFLNDFSLMWKKLNQNKDEEFKVITKKYLNICTQFFDRHPGFIRPQYCNFSKKLIAFKKQTKAFAHSIFESSSIVNVAFQAINTKTIIIKTSSILQYQRDVHQKSFEPQYIVNTIQKNFNNLKVGVSTAYGESTIYLTFFNQHKLDESIFHHTIDSFMNVMLSEKLNPKRDFIVEYNILIDKAIMENDLLKSGGKSSSTGISKVKKF